ncbi:MAG: class II aldolase/adducin family protein, partial [Oceanococcaceae bacterium]
RRVQAAVVTLEGFEMLKGLGGGITRHDTRIDIPLFDNDQDIARLADVIARHHARQPIHHGYLIRGHGVYAWGRDVDDAINHYEALEFLLACALRELPTP